MAIVSSSPRKRHTDADWLRHKPVIERMFIEQRKSLIETRQRLQDDGFPVTKAQLEYKLKLWGFRRRAPKTKSDAVWQFIDRRVQRRQRQGKETEVVIDKRIVDAGTVRKEINRHQESTLAKVSRLQQNVVAGNSPSAFSPRTPDGLEICLNTPAPLPMRFLWPTSLPWNQFQDKFSPVLSAPSLPQSVDSVSLELDLHTEDPALRRMLRFLVPHHKTGTNITQLAAEIGSIMPESYENENFGRASRLLQGTAEERYTEYVKMTLYKLSNDLFSNKVGYQEWKNITELLETSDIMKIPIQLQEITDITMSAIAENLFQRAMSFIAASSPRNAVEDSCNSRIIDWLLRSGQNPNTRIQYVVLPSRRTRVSTPLQVAAHAGSLYLMSRLLDYGACPNLSFVFWDEDSWDGDPNDDQGLGNYQCGMHPLLTTVLKYPEHPSSNDGCLRIFDEVKATGHLAWFVDKFVVIDCTVNFRCESQELHPFFRLLEDAGIQNRSQIPQTVDMTSVVLLAAAKGNTELLEGLHDYGIDTTAIGSLGYSALHVAAHFGHLETCEKLVLEHRTPVNAFGFCPTTPSPLHFATVAGHLSIVRFLHQNKADVNREFDAKDGDWPGFSSKAYPEYVDSSRSSPLVLALVKKNHDVAQYLLENGAKSPRWGAYTATSHGKHKLANLALEAGADPTWGVYAPCTPKAGPKAIQVRFREALKHGNTFLAQQLVLDAQEDDLVNDISMSILEVAINGPTMGKTSAQNPGAYDPGALCVNVIFSASSRDSRAVEELLSNRPQSKESSDLEALAIGLAAWSGQLEVLKLLLAEIHQPMLAKVPYFLRFGLPTFSRAEFYKDGFPFRQDSSYLMSVSPTIFALRSREALSVMLNHGYKPDRSTIRAAVEHFDPDILRTLMKSPRLSHRPDYIQGPLSYAVMHKKYDAVWFLLENGEDVNEDNYHVSNFIDRNRNPLQSAIENSDLYLIDLLLKSGADVNAPAAKEGGATALQLAAISGQLGILRTLVEHGADVNVPGAARLGRTALEGAAEHGRIDVILYLLSTGLRTTDRYRLQYLRAIRYAELQAHMVAANALRGHREWTTDDHVLWTALGGLGRKQLERFKPKTQEMPSSKALLGDNTTLKDGELRDESTKDGLDHMTSEEDVYDPSEGMEPPNDLEDLEMRTNDPMSFMMGDI